MKYLVLPGRILYSLIFIMTIMTHFSQRAVDYAINNGVPSAGLLVPLSGIIACLGGISILLGYKAKWGAWLIVLFLIPVTFFMHAFWKETEPMQKQMQMGNFIKNLSLLGAALLIAYFGAGPVSVDAMQRSATPEAGNLKESEKKHPLKYFSKEPEHSEKS
ncbi:MAG: DoxX family protein [Bacteroidia bacterium]